VENIKLWQNKSKKIHITGEILHLYEYENSNIIKILGLLSLIYKLNEFSIKISESYFVNIVTLWIYLFGKAKDQEQTQNWGKVTKSGDWKYLDSRLTIYIYIYLCIYI
jgi:hypothetical protein